MAVRGVVEDQTWTGSLIPLMYMLHANAKEPQLEIELSC